MSMATFVTAMRFKYHANATDINNALNQLHIISDEKAEERNKKHVMTIVNDILPRMGYDVEEYFKKKND